MQNVAALPAPASQPCIISSAGLCAIAYCVASRSKREMVLAY
jgi:hypothetical protein